MDLRKKLKHGDIKVISELAGVHLSTAEKTLRGPRNNPKVIQAAQLLIESREAIEKKLKANRPSVRP